MIVIINPPPPYWVKMGMPRPPLWLKKYFPKYWEEQLMKYGAPGEIGKYFAEESLKRIGERLRAAPTIRHEQGGDSG